MPKARVIEAPQAPRAGWGLGRVSPFPMGMGLWRGKSFGFLPQNGAFCVHSDT